jgi:hypothetical protein
MEKNKEVSILYGGTIANMASSERSESGPLHASYSSRPYCSSIPHGILSGVGFSWAKVATFNASVSLVPRQCRKVLVKR